MGKEREIKMKIDIEKYPSYLRHDLEALIKAEEEEKATGRKCYHIDCLENELYNSIGAAYREGKIGKEEAIYLHKHFLGMDVTF